MKFIRKYQSFLEKKALLPSQVRRYMKVFNRERYADIFKKYEGDKNHYRIFLPLVAKPTLEDETPEIDENSTENRIKKFLEENQFELIDYIKGIAKFNTAKNPSKIGQILTRLEKTKPEAKELMKAFVEDPTRKAGAVEDLIAVVSRHPFDIAGADTDRAWTNCMTMAHAGSPKVKELQDKLAKLMERKKRISIESSNLELMVDELDNARGIDRDDDDYDHDDNRGDKSAEDELMSDLGYTEAQVKEMKEKRRELDKEEAKIDSQIEALEENIDDRLSTGQNAKYLIYDVKEGSLISFLIKKSDKNIKNPLATLNIKPYINEDNPDDFILVSDTNMYGQTVPEFKQTIDAWLKEVNGKDKEGIFCLNKKLYDDSNMRIELLSKKTAIDRIMNSGNLEDIKPALVKKHIEISDIQDIINALREEEDGRYYEDDELFTDDATELYKELVNVGRLYQLTAQEVTEIKNIMSEFIPKDVIETELVAAEFANIHTCNGGNELVSLLKKNPDYVKYLTYGGIFKPRKEEDRYGDNIDWIDPGKIFDDDNIEDVEISDDFAETAKHAAFDNRDNFADGIFFCEVNKDNAEKLKEMGVRFHKNQAKISKKPRKPKEEGKQQKEEGNKESKKSKSKKESIRSFRNFIKY